MARLCFDMRVTPVQTCYPSMTDKSQSITKRAETEVKDLSRIRKRKPKLFWALVVIAAAYIIIRGVAIPHLASELSKTKEELLDVKRDRDAKASQLAPFLAVANRTFEASPPDKRLDLLVDKMIEILQAVTNTAQKVGALDPYTQPIHSATAGIEISLLNQIPRQREQE